ncbi:MAG: hypothetical protein FXF47_07675 [Candidatus Mcinerneyibacterium aminivorans]|uniref:Uncharacterized protein n=1 Tax=Candidatus Mcinerneyibacterium aminivorans TaxID=2703815 RepID=A0A5D0MEB9_9BACT|nr:MAG: hypothetical protein FXF47_07675 [Candidatus Mcinerneyibacterium aminivorans]
MAEKIDRIKDLSKEIENLLKQNLSMVDKKNVENDLKTELDNIISGFKSLNKGIMEIEKKILPEHSRLFEKLKEKYNFEDKDYEQLKKEYSNIIITSRDILKKNYQLYNSLSELIKRINNLMNENQRIDNLKNKVRELEENIKNLNN